MVFLDLTLIIMGAHTGDIEGFQATGKKIEVGEAHFLRVENGKIVEKWGVKELLILYQQLGFELKPREQT